MIACRHKQGVVSDTHLVMFINAYPYWRQCHYFPKQRRSRRSGGSWKIYIHC